jgi:pimeloyl-ACP methyl ester carboxylesterase
VFSRISARLGEEADRTFHSLLLFYPNVEKSRWSIAAEVDALAQATSPDVSYDIVACSGGAAISLAFASFHQTRIRSLCLIEPPWIGNDLWSEPERQFVADFDQLVTLDDEGCVEAFTRLFAPGRGDAVVAGADEIARWASALRTVWRGYRETSLDRAALARLGAPTLLPVGQRSSSRMMRQAEYLVDHVFPSGKIAVIQDCDHFDIFKAGAGAIAEGLAIGSSRTTVAPAPSPDARRRL